MQADSRTQSWCQVAAEVMPVNSLIVGVDLSPIKAIPKVITFQSDITTEQCRATIRKHLKTWKADTVLHDGAPNVGTAWVQDSFNQAELALQAMKLATDFLVEGGTFVTKVFRSKDYNSLLWVFNQLFTKVEATKPPSSRNVSAEIFVVCRGFKAPKRIDPKFLDPRAVFEDLAAPSANNEAKVYNPELKKRKRGGYEDGDWTQFKELPASEFIQTTDPIAILGGINRLHFDQAKNGDVALAALGKLPETTDEIKRCCEDLKVLGKKEFKMLLKWRLKVRDLFGFPSKKNKQDAELVEETAEVEDMDEEMKIQAELQALKEKEGTRKKKEKRKENEKKQKDIVRMQLNMTAPMDIGMEEQGPMGEDAMFQLKSVDKAGALARIAKGKMIKVSDQDTTRDSGLGTSPDDDDESDDEEDRLEREMDGMYEQYKERKSETDAKYRAKRARKEHKDEEWEGLSADEQAASDAESELEEDSDEDSDAEDGLAGKQTLLTDLEKDTGDASGLSKRARAFFNQDLFKDVEGLLDELAEEVEQPAAAEEMEIDEIDEVSSDEEIQQKVPTKKQSTTATDAPDESEDEEEFEVVKGPKRDEADEDESDWEEEERRQKRDTRPGKLEPVHLLHPLWTTLTCI